MAGLWAVLGRGLRLLLRATGILLKWLMMIFALFAWITIIGDYLDSKKRHPRDRR